MGFAAMKTDRTPPVGTAEEGVVRHRIRRDKAPEPLPRDPGDIVDDAERDEAAMPRPLNEHQER
jgi:hypothetical protein